MVGFTVNIMFQNGCMDELWLSGEPKGRACFSDMDNIKLSEAFSFDAENGKWFINSQGDVSFSTINGETLHKVEVVGETMMAVNNLGLGCAMFIEETTNESSTLLNYKVYKQADVLIGGSPDCDIKVDNSFVSKRRPHAMLRWEQNGWSIYDNESKNGTFVNKKMVKNQRLNVGDVVYISGVKIVVGVDYLSINSGHKSVSIQGGKLELKKETENNIPSVARPLVVKEEEMFNRRPRKRVALKPTKITFDGPPMSINGNNMPLMLQMGSSMFSGAMGMLGGNFSSLINSVAFPLMSKKYTDKEKQEYEEKRVKKYTEYLNEKEKEIEKERQEEMRVLTYNYPPLAKVLTYTEVKTNLWERRKQDDDFLEVRLGSGKIPLLAEIDYPKEKFSLDEDVLHDRMIDLATKPVFLDDAPIRTSLIKNYVTAIKGPRELALNLIERLVMQISLLHSYDEVKLMFFIEPDELEKIEFIKYLPHCWNEYKDMRFIATNSSEAYQLGEQLKREVGDSIERAPKLNEYLKMKPYYVVFALNKKLMDGVEFTKTLMQEEMSHGVSIVTAFEDLPKESKQVFELFPSGENAITYIQDIEKKDDYFRMDSYDAAEAAASMRMLANVNLKTASRAQALPKSVSFLEMLNVGKIEHLNIAQRWKDSNPMKTLACPIGIAEDGSLFSLDLHQKFQGPHGLVAGTTGSGKSEFIITYILSLAVNYHPDEVAFVLIDYKGGGLTGAFDDPARGIHLPHLVGTITNLDGAAIQRSMVSLESELKRRQAVFNHAKSVANEGTMDIYQYQRLYRNRVVDEPMPHLFIISDEFAELKAQQPEFMDNLISVARIGRSLGVHLILATQKPSGVVNDQIKSNTKFSVCLKVADRSDSNDMIGRPDAAMIKECGRFFLQVGNNEFFAMGQSAWAGAPYEPQNKVVVKKDDEISFIDAVGQKVLAVKPEVVIEGTGKSQLVEIVQTLSDMAEEMHIKPRKLWKEPLSDNIDVKVLKESYSEKAENEPICAYLGIIDDPEKQTQYPYRFDFSNCRNLLLMGEQGFGKTTVLQSMMLSLADRYTPEEVNFYVIDCATKNMDCLRKLKHCGAVASEGEDENIKKIFEIIQKQINDRKELFVKYEVTSFDALNAYERVPLSLVFIDNFPMMSESAIGDFYARKIADFAKNASTYGIKFILTCNHFGDMTVRAKQELGSRMTLKLKDKYEYGDVLLTKVKYEPPEKNGRGMVIDNDRPMEIQYARYFADVQDKDRIKAIRSKVQELNEKYYDSAPAIGVPEIPDDQTFEEFAETHVEGTLSLVYSIKDAKHIRLPLKQLTAMSVYMGNSLGIKPIIKNLLHAIGKENPELYVVKRTNGSIFEKTTSLSEPQEENYINLDKDGLVDFMNFFTDKVVQRAEMIRAYTQSPAFAEVGENDKYNKVFEYMRMNTKPLFLFLESYDDFGDLFVNSDFNDQMSAVLSGFRGLNCYVIACMYPNDGGKMGNAKMTSAMHLEQMSLLFGGNYAKQRICVLPRDDGYSMMQASQANKGAMKYRETYYLVQMPCGVLLQPTGATKEDANIFE